MFGIAVQSTVCMSLLQPQRETYNLFDDVLLLADGEWMSLTICAPPNPTSIGIDRQTQQGLVSMGLQWKAGTSPRDLGATCLSMPRSGRLALRSALAE
jgi:hypothetical protein